LTEDAIADMARGAPASVLSDTLRLMSALRLITPPVPLSGCFMASNVSQCAGASTQCQCHGARVRAPAASGGGVTAPSQQRLLRVRALRPAAGLREGGRRRIARVLGLLVSA
jgi:hypothetical protein